MQRDFWRDWWQMVTKTHNLRLVLRYISFLLLITSIIGIVTLDRQTHELWSNVSIAVLIAIVLLYLWHFFIEIPAKIMNEKNIAYEQTLPLRKLEQHQRENPQEYIFPSILRLDAQQLQYGKDSITINYYLASALPFEMKFTAAKAYLVLRGNEVTNQKDISVLTIKPHKSNYDYIEMDLGGKVSKSAKDDLSKRVSMRFKIRINCWDKDGTKKYPFGH